MKHSKIKGLKKRRKRNHVTHFSLGLGPVCMPPKTYKETFTPWGVRRKNPKWTSLRIKTTCKKCKKTPQFLIHDYERRFLGKTH